MVPGGSGPLLPRMPPPVWSPKSHMWYWLPSGIGMVENFQPSTFSAQARVADGSALAISVWEMKPGRTLRCTEGPVDVFGTDFRVAAALRPLPAGLFGFLAGLLAIGGP